ncbi:MAG: tetratricopeptide repeat protein, partial [Gemmatimonadales bacterium]
GPYLTVGKRHVTPEGLRERLPPVIRRISDHLTALYQTYADALDCQDRGDVPGVVTCLLRAGAIERSAGRLSQAAKWCGVAYGVAEGLSNRRPEVETLLALGAIDAALGQYADAGRAYQRAFTLAEAEFDQAGVIAACRGLGAVALQQGDSSGALTWLSRALRQAEAASDGATTGRVLRLLGIVYGRQGDLTRAGEYLHRAAAHFAPLGEAVDMARTLDAQGEVELALGRHAAAMGAYREALAWARRTEREWSLEAGIRVHLAELLLETGGVLDAEEELRRAEQLAIAQGLGRRLVRVYTLMGRVRGLQHDETGFVFFEQAIALCRTLERSAVMLADVYHRYGAFKQLTGQREEAHALLERARDLYEAMGGGPGLDLVREELRRVSA